MGIFSEGSTMSSQRALFGRRFSQIVAKLALLVLTATFALSSGALSPAAHADSNYAFNKIALSGTGSVVYATNANGSIWKSSDTGTTWSALTAAGVHNWISIATSQSGSVVVAAEASGSLYLSTDSGASWNTLSGAGSRAWRTVVISNDGSKIKAITSNTKKLYESGDFGATWSENATLPTVLNTDFNPDGTRSSSGCSNPCAVPSWSELTMSGSGNKIALLVQAPGPYQSGRQLFISLDSGATWEETEGCCRDQSTSRQIASSRSDTNWTIMMGNYQSAPGYLRYDSANQRWTRTQLRVHEQSGDGTSIYTTTWRGFAVAADGDQTIFTGQFYGWDAGHAGRYESLFTGAISTELAGVYHNENPGSYYSDVAISDSGVVRAALKGSTGEFVVSTDSGATFNRIKIFLQPITPSLGSVIEYTDSYTVQVSNYDSTFTWTVSTTSGTASISNTGLVTVSNPIGSSTLTVRTNKTGVQEGLTTYNALDIHRALIPTFGSQVDSSESFTVDVTNFNPIYNWSVSTGSGSASIDGNGIITVVNPIGSVVVTVLTSRTGFANGSATFSSRDLHVNRKISAIWDSAPHAVGTDVFNNVVFDIAQNPVTGDIYAGGSFTDVGGDADADFIARFDGTSWHGLSGPAGGLAQGSGNGSWGVFAIAFDAAGNLYVGGNFNNAGAHTDADYFAKWNGTDWSGVGSSNLNGVLRDIDIAADGKITIAGQFTDAGSVTGANYVARYDGTSWSKLGATSLNDKVLSIARSKNGAIYIGGQFSNAGGDTNADRVAKLSGNDWVSIGGADAISYSYVRAIAVDDRTSTDILYAGGYYNSGSGNKWLGKWDGSTWTFPNFGLTSDIRRLYFDPLRGLFFAGWFQTDNRYARGLGLYVDGNYYGIGDENNDGTGTSSATQSVEAVLVTQDGALYIGGWFNSIASVANTANLARTLSWDSPTLDPVNNSAPTLTSEQIASLRAQAAREREDQINQARKKIIQSLVNGESVSAQMMSRADYPSLNPQNLGDFNLAVLALSVDLRSQQVTVAQFVAKFAIVEDLSQASPRAASARPLVVHELISSNALMPTLTLKILKSLPVAQRANLDLIKQSVSKIQLRFTLQRSKVEKLRLRK